MSEGKLITVVGRIGLLKKIEALTKVGNILEEVKGYTAAMVEKENPNIVVAEFKSP